MGLPLPLGSIIASKALDEDTRARFERLLRKSIEYAFENPMASRAFIKEHAQELEDDVIEKHIALFVNDYSLALGDEGSRAVEELLE